MAQKTAFHRLLAIFIVGFMTLGALPLMAPEAAAVQPDEFELLTLAKTGSASTAFAGTDDQAVVSVVNCHLGTTTRTSTTTVTVSAGAGGGSGSGTLALTLTEAPEADAGCTGDRGGLFIGRFLFANGGVSGNDRLPVKNGDTVTVTAGTGSSAATPATGTWSARNDADLRLYRVAQSGAQSWAPIQQIYGSGANIVQVNLTDADLSAGATPSVQLRTPRLTASLGLGAAPTAKGNHTGTFDPKAVDANLADGEVITVAYADVGANGLRTVVEKNLVWREAATKVLQLRQQDYETAYDATSNFITGNSATLYLRVNDPDANTDPLTVQSVTARLRAKPITATGDCTVPPPLTGFLDQETVTLFESSPDSGVFLAPVAVKRVTVPAPGNGQIGISGTLGCVAGVYNDARATNGEPGNLGEVPAVWTTSAPTLTLRNAQNAVASVFAGNTRSNGSGTKAVVEVNDAAAPANAIAVARHQSLSREQCNALLPPAGVGTDRCRVLTLTKVGSLFSGELFFNVPSTAGANYGKSLTIGNGETFQVEYVAAISETGARKPFLVQQGVWGILHDARAWFDKTSYRVGETVTVFVVDRDVGTPSSETPMRVTVTSGNDTTGATVTLVRDTADPNRFKAAFTLEAAPATSASDAVVAVGDGDLLSITYTEYLGDRHGEKGVIPTSAVTTARANHVTTASVVFDKLRYNEGDQVTLTSRDQDAVSTDKVVIRTSVAGFATGNDQLLATGTDPKNVQAVFKLEGPDVVTVTLSNVGPCPGTITLDGTAGQPFPIVPGTESVTDSTKSWFRAGSPGAPAPPNEAEYGVNYLTGAFTFPAGTQTGSSCVETGQVPRPTVSAPLTITYRPYQLVKENFFADIGQKNYTLQASNGGAAFADAWPNGATPTDRDEATLGTPNTTVEKLVPEGTCATCVKVSVNGVALAATAYNWDEATGIVTLTNAPTAGAHVEISYRANNVLRKVVCSDGPTNCNAAATGVPAFVDGKAPLNFDIGEDFGDYVDQYSHSGLTLQVNGQTHVFDPVVASRTFNAARTGTDQVNFYGVAGKLPDADDINNLYLDVHTGLDGNGKIGVRDGAELRAFVRESDGTVKNLAGQAFYLGRNAPDLAWARGHRTHGEDLFFGTGAKGTIRVVDPDANKAATAADTITVVATTYAHGAAGQGTAIETETMTLTETDFNSGEFTRTIEFETTPTANNGKLAVGSNDQAWVLVTYADPMRLDPTVLPSIHARWYKSNPASLNELDAQYLGESDLLVVTASDADGVGRLVNVRMVDGATEGTCVVDGGSVAVDATAYHAVFVNGVVWTKHTAAGDPTAQKYKLTASTGALEMGPAAAGAAPACSAVRADYKRAGVPQTMTVFVEARDTTGDNAIEKFARPITLTAPSASTSFSNVNTPVQFTTSADLADPTTNPNRILVRQGAQIRVSLPDVNYAACTLPAGSTLTETCTPTGPLAVKTSSWQTATNARVFVRTQENLFGAATSSGTDGYKPYAFGAETTRIRVVDLDENQNPTTVETVQVKVRTATDPVGRNVTLHETTTSSGIFEAGFRFNDPSNLVAARHGDRYFIEYTDLRTLAGGVVVRQVSEGPFNVGALTECAAGFLPGAPNRVAGSDCNGATGTTDYRWWSANRGAVTLNREQYAGTSTEGRLVVTVADPDRNLDASTRETLEVDVRSFAGFFPTLGATTSDDESLTLTETQVASGIFQGELPFAVGAKSVDDGALQMDASGGLVQVAYRDPHNATGGRHAAVLEEARWFPGTSGIVVLNKGAYSSRSELVEVLVLDDNLPTSGLGSIRVQVRDAATGAAASPLTLSKIANFRYRGVFGLEQTDTDGVADIAITDGQTLELRYLDKSAVPGAPGVSVGLLRFKVITSTIQLALETTPQADGENGWHVTAPTVSFTATDPDGALDHIEYRIGVTGEFQTYTGPFAITGEGVHEVFYRAVNVLGEVQPESNTTVRFDATAPTQKVTTFSATPVARGLIQINVTPPVDLSKTDPLNFGSYKVFMDSKSDPAIGSGTEDVFTVDPGDEEQHTYWVGIADAAGNIDTSILNLSKTATADKTPPNLLTATLTPAEFTLEIDAPSSVAIAATVETPLPADFDKVVAVVRDPFGDFVTNVTLTEGAAGVFAGTFAGWTITGTYNVSVQALDKVGNADTILAALQVRGIDTVPPRVELLDTSVAKGDPVRVRVTDNDRGVKSVTYTVNNGAVQTVAVSGTPLTLTFEVPTSGLSVGSHTLVVVAADANETANVRTETLVFQVTQGSEQTGGKPVVELVRRYAEHGGVLDVRVTTSGTLTLLAYSLDGGPEETALGQLVGGVLKVNVASLEPGAHRVLVKATTLGAQPTSLTLDFTVLPEGVPLPPDGVTVTRQGGEVRVSWTASASDSGKIGGYLVHRRASPWRVIADVGASVISFTDADPPSSKSLAYTVTAYGPNDEGRAAVGSDSENVGFALEGLVVAPVSGAASTALWIVLLVALAVLVAVGLAYSQRGRLFPRREEDGEAPMDEDAGPGMATVAAYEPSQVQRHALRCPACGEQFAVTGVKPIITTCPNCGRKGILR